VRDLPFELASRIFSGRRLPAFKIYAWDPEEDNYASIISGEYNQSPADLTPYCSDIQWTPGRLTFTLKDDETMLFNPDTGTAAPFLVSGAIIRLKEGDDRVGEGAWLWTFTGNINGQIGWSRSRRGRKYEAKVTVFSRENSQGFKRRKVTSPSYTVGTDLGIMLRDICLATLGMSEAELRVPPTLGYYFHHNTNQIVEMTPWESFESILQVGLQAPYFDGEGKLAGYRRDANRPPEVVLPDGHRIYDIEVVQRTGDATNKVIVTYLDSQLTEVDGEYQKLGTAQITTGFFTSEEKLDCWWSEDRRQRARNTRLKVIKGVNDNLLPVGTEKYQEIDEFHGRITITISSWVPILATVMVLEYLAAAAIPDKTTSQSMNTTPTILTAPGEIMLTAPPMGGPVTGVITIAPAKVNSSEVPGTGLTIPWGRVLQAQASIAIMLIMMSLGSAQYEVWGTPYDLCYLEKTVVAQEEGLEYWQEVELEIKNDFIGTAAQAEALGLNELLYQRGAACPRKVAMEDHPGIEIGDIVQLPDGRRVFVQDMAKTLKRGEIPILELTGFKVLTV